MDTSRWPILDFYWTAEVGVANAAWLADPATFDLDDADHDLAPTDRGNGRVTISRDQMDMLREFAEPGGEEPGDLAYDDEHGMCLFLPFDVAGAEQVTGFWLTQRYGRLPVS